jgi:arylsulfatase A-like enzyme
VKQLHDYDVAFGKFFANLKAAGIDQSNTLFVFTPDEGDHFVGTAPTNSCDGVTTACTYPANGVGEIQINLAGLTVNAGDSTPFKIHSDDAPTVYVPGQPGPTDPTVRQLERTMATLTATNPHIGTPGNLMVAMADPVEESMLHMVTQADPARTPTFTFFGDPNYFFLTSGSTTPTVGTGFAWNHGDIQPEIARTFIAIAGPGVQNLGVTDSFFSDHVDVRPTIMYLSGLTDDYQHDGRVLMELIDPQALGHDLHAHHETLLRLGQVYKQINAPFGQLAMATLKVSTHALQITSTNDATYTQLEGQIASWTATRNNLAAQMKALLEGAEFGGQATNEQQAKSLISQGQSLIDQANSVAASL